MTLTLTASNKETGDWITLDEDTYDASYQRYEEFNGGEYGPAIKMFFNVAYADAQGKNQYTEISGIASIPEHGLGMKSKLRSWIEPLIGRPLADGESINLESLANSPCRLLLSVKKGKVRDDGTQATFNRIDKVLAPRKRATKPAPAAEDLV